MRFLHYILQRISVNCDHHDHIHLFLDKIADLRNLLLHITVCDLHVHLCAKLLRSQFKLIPVPQPPLDHKRIETHPDLQAVLLICLRAAFLGFFSAAAGQ